MTEIQATRMLEREHRYIEMVLGALAALGEKIEAGGRIDPGLFAEIADFMRNYADRDHHGKEEAEMFPALEKKGVPVNGCPIGGLRHEHVRGRQLVGELAAAATAYSDGLPAAADELLKAIRGLLELYPRHIWREDYLLFPMTEKIMSADELDELNRKFLAVDEEFGAGAHEKYEKFAVELKKRIAD